MSSKLRLTEYGLYLQVTSEVPGHPITAFLYQEIPGDQTGRYLTMFQVGTWGGLRRKLVGFIVQRGFKRIKRRSPMMTETYSKERLRFEVFAAGRTYDLVMYRFKGFSDFTPLRTIACESMAEVKETIRTCCERFAATKSMKG